MLTLIVFTEFFLIGLLLMPSMALFTAVKKDGPSLISMLMSPEIDEKKYQNKKISNLIYWWMLGLMLITGVFLMATIFFAGEWAKYRSLLLWIVITISCFICAVTTLLFTLKIGNSVKIREISVEFWFIILLVGIWQLLLVTFITLIAVRIAMPSESYWRLWFYSLIIALCVGFIQLLWLFLFVVIKKNENPIGLSALIGAVIVVLLGMFPFSAEYLVAHAFQAMSSGGRKCVTLTWGNAAGSDIDALRDESEPKLSKPLRIFMDANDIYQVRLAEEQDEVYFVPHRSVIGMKSCPKQGGAGK